MLVSALLMVLASLGLFLYLVYRGWFARLRRGFHISLILAVAGSAFASAGLFGVWAWVRTKDIIFQEKVNDLRDAGQFAEANLDERITSALSDLKSDAYQWNIAMLVDKFTKQTPLSLFTYHTDLNEFNMRFSPTAGDAIGKRLDIIMQSHERFLGSRVIGADGKLIATRGMIEMLEPPNAAAVRYALEGKEFVSEVRYLSFFNKYIVDLAAPIRDQQGTITGALTCRYDLQTDLVNILKYMRLGRSGEGEIVSDRGKIVAHAKPEFLNKDVSSYLAVQRALRGETGWVTAIGRGNVRKLFFYHPFDFPATVTRQRLIVLTEIDEQEALAPIRAARSRFLMGMGVLTVLAVLSGYVVSTSMLRPVDSLNEFVKKVEAGELSARLSIREKDEIGRLGTALNQMARGLEERDKIKEALVASHKVLEVAREIQMGLLPRKFPAFPDLPQVDIFGTVRPALEVGGDLYNFFRLDEDRICFVVGDVSDKGVPAALFMAMVLTSFEISARTGTDSIATVLERVNRFLNANNDSQMFVTLFAGILDLRTGSIEYSDGGHEPPFILRRGAGVEMLQKKGGIALGFIDPCNFPLGTVKLAPGDTLFLYTDGVNEAMNSARQMFTTSAIGETLRAISNGKPAERICEMIINRVDEFVQGAPQSDDITLMAIRYCGSEGWKAPAEPSPMNIPV